MSLNAAHSPGRHFSVWIVDLLPSSWMKKVSIWVTLGAVVAAFAGGFSFANYLNRGQMTGLQAANSAVTSSSGQPASQQDTLTPEEIEQKLEEAKADPSNFGFQKGLGLGLYRYGAVRQDTAIIEKAIPVLERANGLNPDDFDVLVGLGNAYFDVGYFGKDNGSFEKARSFYSKALAKRPGDVEVITDVALSFFLMTPPEHVAAVREFEKALALEPKHEKSLGFLIQSLDALGRDASKYRETLRSINPQNPNLQPAVSNRGVNK
jgi:tetratricopeptide (TPR) repeat protein